MNDDERYKQGIQVRTEVLGEKHVNRSIENLNDFNSDFQNFISRFAWGEVWSRPGMPRHTRSLVTMAVLLPPSSRMLRAKRAAIFGATSRPMRVLPVALTSATRGSSTRASPKRTVVISLQSLVKGFTGEAFL